MHTQSKNTVFFDSVQRVESAISDDGAHVAEFIIGISPNMGCEKIHISGIRRYEGYERASRTAGTKTPGFAL